MRNLFTATIWAIALALALGALFYALDRYAQYRQDVHIVTLFLHQP